MDRKIVFMIQTLTSWLSILVRTLFNPLYPNISMNILHTVHHTFNHRKNLSRNRKLLIVGDHFLYSHNLYV